MTLAHVDDMHRQVRTIKASKKALRFGVDHNAGLDDANTRVKRVTPDNPAIPVYRPRWFGSGDDCSDDWCFIGATGATGKAR